MELLSLPDARLSLEFTAEELPSVMWGLRSAARRFGWPVRLMTKQATTHQDVRIGRARFILMTDDGDPALLSTSGEGDALLRGVMAAHEPPGADDLPKRNAGR